MEEKFLTWIKSNNNHITKPEKYSSTITTISNHFKKSFNKEIDLYKIIDFRQASLLRDEYFSREEFISKNVKGNRMYSRSFDLYIEFLELNTDMIDEVILNNINSDTSLTQSEKTTIILSRIGQGKYRSDLINLWNTCSISKFKDIRLLIASHIKPWKISNNSERIDKFNGLLLLPTYDKLFDLGFISFEDSGKIIISNEISDLDLIGINPNIRIDLKPENIKYIHYHRENVFRNSLLATT
ncbi:HNH endonuclease [Flavobacterium akiainvivens]|uniref:HNH endonuclease n=1 Tax=Flavobacterium akiainvivens TaxID=1202724 RepID=UPI0006C8AE46|nr:HNH endonuclease [Flavobacterium akiainvivens]SFQ58414.1 HNH endonuclease [Flavobacterium akiainvivens]